MAETGPHWRRPGPSAKVPAPHVPVPALRPSEFKKWRKSLKLSQKEAAEALGLKRRVVQYYEKGERDGEPVKIPKTVRLACYAVAKGAKDYHGSKGKD